MNKNKKARMQTKQGSVLAYSLIILAMMLAIATSISIATLSEKKSASGTEFSMQALQVADSGSQIAFKAIKDAANTTDIKTIFGVPYCDLVLKTNCCDSVKKLIISGDGAAGPMGSHFELSFYDGVPVRLGCDDLKSQISTISSVGVYNNTVRAVGLGVGGNGVDPCIGLPATIPDKTDPTILYKPITGEDGKCWLDRNLGAKSAPSDLTGLTGPANRVGYGWLFQWGRAADGHQYTAWGYKDATTNSSLSKFDANATTSFNSTDTVLPPNDVKFITSSISPSYDWHNPQKLASPTNLWDGSMNNNPCPTGFHVPTGGTDGEWDRLMTAIHINTCSPTCLSTVLASNLKLTAGGFRDRDGKISNTDVYGNYWSSTPMPPPSPEGALGVVFNNNGLYPSSAMINAGQERASGYSVRCIRDNY